MPGSQNLFSSDTAFLSRSPVHAHQGEKENEKDVWAEHKHIPEF